MILAPYGLAANLTGIGYREDQGGSIGINKFLEEWKAFYSMPDIDKDSQIPPVVEVVCGKSPPPKFDLLIFIN